MNRRQIGNAAEDSAAAFIVQQGWQIIGRNLHYRFGEIDILADSGDFLIICEVKAKQTKQFGSAIEMITPTKKRTLVKLAKWVEATYNKPVRIDVIAIDGDQLTHYPFALGD